MADPYLITRQPHSHSEYTVWNPDKPEPYTVRLGPHCTCTCPHFSHRLNPGQKCKHILMAEAHEKQEASEWYAEPDVVDAVREMIGQ